MKKGVFQLMGALCKYYPEFVSDSSGRRNYASAFSTVLALELKQQVRRRFIDPPVT